MPARYRTGHPVQEFAVAGNRQRPGSSDPAADDDERDPGPTELRARSAVRAHPIGVVVAGEDLLDPSAVEPDRTRDVGEHARAVRVERAGEEAVLDRGEEHG